MGEDGFEAPTEPEDARFFDREWALRVVEQALAGLEARFREEGAGDEFNVLRNFLPGTSATIGYEEAAAHLGVSLPRLKTDIHRLRQDFRFLLRASVARTVSAPHEIDAELFHLRQVLSKVL